MATVLEIRTGVPTGVDLSIDPKLIAECRQILGGQNVTPDQAAAWIGSPEKRRRERVLARFGILALAILEKPISASIKLAAGNPVRFDLPVGFVGENNEIVSPTVVPKFRTLQNEYAARHTQLYGSSAACGGRMVLTLSDDERTTFNSRESFTENPPR